MNVPPAGDARRRGRAARTRAVDAATIEDVARHAGVSVATVSRALRGLPNVAEPTRRRVQDAADELDYRPDAFASRLATGRNDTVGLAVPRIDDWYFSQVAAGAEGVLAGAGVDVLLCSVGDAAGRAGLLAGPSAVRRRLDGLVLIDVLLTDDEVSLLARERANVVTVGQHTERFPSVTVDDEAAARTLTEHLLSLGHRRIAIIGTGGGAPLPFDVPRKRVAGYRAALADAGHQNDPALERPADFTVSGGHDAMAGLLRSDEPPTAVFALSDAMAIGALRACREQGIGVPGDLSVAGFDDRDLAPVFDLTTVHQDPRSQGETAARLLLDLHRQPESAPRHAEAEARLVVRGSTGPPPGGGR